MASIGLFGSKVLDAEFEFPFLDGAEQNWEQNWNDRHGHERPAIYRPAVTEPTYQLIATERVAAAVDEGPFRTRRGSAVFR